MYLDPVQTTNVVLSLVTAIAIVLQMIQTPKKASWGLPMLFWMCHTVVYYLIVFIDRNAQLPFSTHDWSSVLRLHGYITVLSLEIARWYEHRTHRGRK